MARLFMVGNTLPVYSTEKCEDTVIAISMKLIEKRIPKSDEWLSVFNDHFWHGKAIALKSFECMNTYLRRVNLREIEFEETHPQDDYVRNSTYTIRKEYRAKLLNDIESKSEAELKKILGAAWISVDELPLSHKTHAEWAEEKASRNSVSPKYTIKSDLRSPAPSPEPKQGTQQEPKKQCNFDDIRWLIEQTSDQSIKDALVKKAATMIGAAS